MLYVEEQRWESQQQTSHWKQGKLEDSGASECSTESKKKTVHPEFYNQWTDLSIMKAKIKISSDMQMLKNNSLPADLHCKKC